MRVFRKTPTLLFLIVFAGCSSNYDKAEREFEQGNYDEAKAYYLLVKPDDKDYDSVQQKLLKLDSLIDREVFNRAESLLSEKLYSDAQVFFIQIGESSPFYRKSKIYLRQIDSIRNVRALESEQMRKKYEEQNKTTKVDEQSDSGQKRQAENSAKKVLRTEYFDVTVNKVSTSESVRTGNEFADLEPEEGILYLILNVTFKNTDNESRMIGEGSVFINYNGKEYEYDKAETILLEGWGILLDQINPLTSKTTNIVYKIPAEIKGPVYYEPGRNYDSKRIYLGAL